MAWTARTGRPSRASAAASATDGFACWCAPRATRRSSWRTRRARRACSSGRSAPASPSPGPERGNSRVRARPAGVPAGSLLQPRALLARVQRPRPGGGGRPLEPAARAAQVPRDLQLQSGRVLRDPGGGAAAAGVRRRRAAGLRGGRPGPRRPADRHRPPGARARGRLYRILGTDVLPGLAAGGIERVRFDELTDTERRHVDALFRASVYPVLTPLAIDPGHPFPHVHNKSLNIALVVDRKNGSQPRRHFAVVQVPAVLDRVVVVSTHGEGRVRFVLLEDIIARHLGELFGGLRVVSHTRVRVTRHTDLPIDAEAA